jgi:hypothetical protein
VVNKFSVDNSAVDLPSKLPSTEDNLTGFIGINCILLIFSLPLLEILVSMPNFCG